MHSIRTQILDLPEAMLSSGKVDINWEDADKKLKWAVEPIIKDCIEAGIIHAENVSGKGKALEPDAITEQAVSYLNLKVTNIVITNKTLKKLVEERINRDIAPLLADGATMTEIAQGVKDSVREFFNIAGSRAKLIARTETVGAINGGSLIYYKEQGFEKKKWVTANDEFVRESHRGCQQAGWIDIDGTFPNGLEYAGDQSTNDPAEVCNCRCTIIAD